MPKLTVIAKRRQCLAAPTLTLAALLLSGCGGCNGELDKLREKAQEEAQKALENATDEAKQKLADEWEKQKGKAKDEWEKKKDELADEWQEKKDELQDRFDTGDTFYLDVPPEPVASHRMDVYVMDMDGHPPEDVDVFVSFYTPEGKRAAPDHGKWFQGSQKKVTWHDAKPGSYIIQVAVRHYLRKNVVLSRDAGRPVAVGDFGHDEAGMQYQVEGYKKEIAHCVVPGAPPLPTGREIQQRLYTAFSYYFAHTHVAEHEEVDNVVVQAPFPQAHTALYEALGSKQPISKFAQKLAGDKVGGKVVGKLAEETLGEAAGPVGEVAGIALVYLANHAEGTFKKDVLLMLVRDSAAALLPHAFAVKVVLLAIDLHLYELHQNWVRHKKAPDDLVFSNRAAIQVLPSGEIVGTGITTITNYGPPVDIGSVHESRHIRLLAETGPYLIVAEAHEGAPYIVESEPLQTTGKTGVLGPGESTALSWVLPQGKLRMGGVHLCVKAEVGTSDYLVGFVPRARSREIAAAVAAAGK